jgi:antitoxin YefM
MLAISYSKASRNLNAVIDAAVAGRAPIAIRRRSQEGVVVICESDWASIQDTLAYHADRLINL